MFLVIKALTIVTASNIEPKIGVPVNLTATLWPSNCTGTVDFWQGAYSDGYILFEQIIGTASVDALGRALYTWNSAFGQVGIAAVYTASDFNTFFGATSDAIQLNALGSGTAAVYLNVTSGGSQIVKLNAYVTPTDATGVVNFYDTKISVPFIVGTAPVIDGVASYNWTNAPPGIHQYQAQYMGSMFYRNFSSSTVRFTTI